MRVSPTWAVMLGGLKARTPVPPTIILWSLLDGTPDDVGTGAGPDVDETEGGEVAADWKAANCEALAGFRAKTMPELQ